MKENKMLVADFAKLKEAKDAISKMRRGTEINATDLLNVFEDTINSFEERAVESDEDVINRVLDQFKDGKAGNEVINKAIENELTKREQARKVVDMKNDPEVAKKFANCVIKSMETSQSVKMVDAMRQSFGNDISGLVFPVEVETAIRRAWERSERIMALFNRTQRAYIPYTAQDGTDNDVLARIQTNPSTEKEEQHLEIQYIQLMYDYFYKLQYLHRSELNRARQAGNEVALVAEIFGELTQQVINGIVTAALITGASGAAGVFIESIARTTGDVFVSVATMASTNPTIAEVRAIADKVITDNRKVLLCSSATKTILETLAAGHTTGLTYMPEDILLSQVGCDEVITNACLGNAIIVLADGAYTIGDFEVETFRFDRYEFNKQGLLAEMLTTGKMRDVAGAGVLLPQNITITITSGTLAVSTGTIANGTHRFISGGVSESIAISSGTGTATLIADGTYRVISQGVGVDGVDRLALIMA